MWNEVSQFLNNLSHRIMNLPVFHWFRIVGGGLAIVCGVIWFATDRWDVDDRWEVVGRIAGWVALVGLALWVVGWLAGTLVAIFLVLIVIAAGVLVLFDYLQQHP